MTLLSEVPYASILRYATNRNGDDSDIAKHSRNVRDLIKRPAPDMLAKAAELAAEMISAGSDISRFIGAEVTLVPVPRSAPLTTGAIWPALEIARALQRNGLAQDISEGLVRIKRVPKSAYCRADERPDAARHYETIQFDIQPDLITPRSLCIIDDVLTRGCTTLACASRVAEAYPQANIRVLTLLRPVSVGVLTTIKHEEIGTIRLAANGRESNTVPA